MRQERDGEGYNCENMKEIKRGKAIKRKNWEN